MYMYIYIYHVSCTSIYPINIPHISLFADITPPAFAGAQGLKEMCGDAILLWKLLEP